MLIKFKKTHSFKHIRKQMKIVCPFFCFLLNFFVTPKKKKKISTYQIATTNGGAWIL